MKRKNMGCTHHSMCVQPTFIIGTFNEDGTPDFAPITWLSATCEKDHDFLIVISMYGTKMTKQNVFRTKQLCANLVSTDMLDMTDYFGSISCRSGTKDGMNYGWSESSFVYAPMLDASRWVYELEVIKTVNTGESDTFFCRIKNVQIDQSIDISDGVDLTKLDPVVYSGHYHSVGNHLGRIGDFLPNHKNNAM